MKKTRKNGTQGSAPKDGMRVAYVSSYWDDTDFMFAWPNRNLDFDESKTELGRALHEAENYCQRKQREILKEYHLQALLEMRKEKC